MLINITKINLNPNVGGGKPIELENKEITITENGTTTVVPSDGFGGMSSVDIDVYIANPAEEIDFSEIGYDATDNQNANMAIQDGIEYAKKIQAEYTDSKTYRDDGRLIYFPMVDSSNRTSCADLFNGCGGLQYVPPLTISNKCTAMYRMFSNCKALTYLDVSNFDTSNIISIREMFLNCQSLKELDLSSWDTSSLTTLGGDYTDTYPFYNMTNLQSINLTGWNISKVTKLNNLFYECNSLSEIKGIENFDTSNIITAYNMFYDCKSLTTLDLSNWNTSNFTNINYMFADCSSLTSLDLSNWNTSNLTKLNSIFSYCTSLSEIKGIENFDTSNISTMERTFYECKSLTTLDLSNWNTSNLTNINYMFANCSSLTSLDLSSWDVQNITIYDNTFSYCSNLTNFQAPQNINARISFSNCNKLTVDSILSILNNLTDRTSTTSLTCTLGSTNLNKLTAEQKAIATSKNWVLQ